MTRRFVPRQFKPYPEIVEPEPHDAPYKIIDTRGKDWLPTNGMVSKAERRLFVPLDPSGRPVSRHELSHVLWSPKELPKVPYDRRVLLAVEDARINLGMERKELPVRLSAGDCGHVAHLAAEDLERKDVGTFVLRAIASIGTNAVKSTLAPADDAAVEIRDLATRLVRRVRSRLHGWRRRAGGPVAPFEATRRIAADVARELDALGLLNERSAARSVVLPGTGCCLSHEEEKAPGRRARPALLELERHLRSLREGSAGDGGAVAGRMRIVEAPLGVACPNARGAARDWRPAVEGSVISYPGRWCLDRAIFRRAVRRRGGSVLVDTSGSMSLDAEGVDRILRSAPSATLVAMYSGSGRTGELRVVARDGRRAAATHLKPYGGANVVDAPALDWLAKQPAPRVWISDGCVSGVGDHSSPGISRHCAATCRRAGIRRVRKVEDAARVLEGRGGGPRLPFVRS